MTEKQKELADNIVELTKEKRTINITLAVTRQALMSSVSAAEAKEVVKYLKVKIDD